VTNEKELINALEQIEREKGISKLILLDAIQDALGSALKRNFGNTQNLTININPDNGHVSVLANKKVVDKVMEEQAEILHKEALKFHKDCKVGDFVVLEITPSNFGRIAAQTAKQVIVQRIREAERELRYREFLNRKEEIITGSIQKIEQNRIYVDLGNVEAILPSSEQVPSEKYRQGDRIKAYILDVKLTSKGPQVVLSRTHPGFLNRLFELEVPEIYEKIVEIKSTAREAGYRSKIAVTSNQEGVDPVGSCVGSRGARVLSVVQELRGEKIDIVLWDPEPSVFISNALNPAKVVSVELLEDNSAIVVVPDNQLSLAIGKDGQNARLAAKLTGWKIDIKNKTIYDEEQEKSRVMDELIGGLVESLNPLTVIAVEVQEKQKNFLFTITFEDYLEAFEKAKGILPGEPCQDWTLTVQPPLIGPDGEFQMGDVAELLMKLLHPVEIVSLKLNKKEKKLLLSIYEKDISEVRKKQEENISLSKLGEWNIVPEPLVEEGLDESLIPVLLEAISPVNVISLEIEEKEKMIVIFVPQEETGEAREKLETVQLPASLSAWKIDIEPFNVEQK